MTPHTHTQQVQKLRRESASLSVMCEDIKISGMKVDQLESLSAMYDAARRSFVPPNILNDAENILKVLRVKAEMEKAKIDLNRKRPCKKSSDTTELRRVTIRAKEAGVDERALREMARLIETACSEMRLNQCVLQCREIECADESHAGLRKRLEKMIQECASAGGYDSLVRSCRSQGTFLYVKKNKNMNRYKMLPHYLPRCVWRLNFRVWRRFRNLKRER